MAASAVAVLVAVFATNPFLDMGTNDDWSFAYGALKFAQTGRLVYCSWSRPFLGLQAVWGAAAIHVFGFSFTVLRLSLLPFAMGSAVLVYLLARRVGLNAGLALFGTLTFSLSPLYVPLAASFMTETPNLFFILLSLYGCIAALRSHRNGACALWLAIVTLAGIAGGTVRQTGFMVPLSMLPVLMICSSRIRGRFTLQATAAALWSKTKLSKGEQAVLLPKELDASLSLTVEHIDLMAEAKTFAEAFRLSQRLIGGELEFDDSPEVIEASDDAT